MSALGWFYIAFTVFSAVTGKTGADIWGPLTIAVVCFVGADLAKLIKDGDAA